MQKLFLIWVVLFYALPVFAQKPVLDTGILGKWPVAESGSISDDGKYVLYAIGNTPCSCQELVVVSSSGDFREDLHGASAGHFGSGGQLLIYLQGMDSLCLWRLGSEQREYLTGIGSGYQLSKDGRWLVYQQGEGKDCRLVVRDLLGQRERHYSGVLNYRLADPGNALVLLRSVQEDSTGMIRLYWVDTEEGSERMIWQGLMPRSYQFNEQQDGVCFYSEGSSGRSLWYCGKRDKTARMLAGTGHVGEDTTLEVQGETPVFSHDGQRIVFKLVERSVPQAPAGAVPVDVWSYRDKDLQSSQLRRLGPASFLSIVNISDGHILRLQKPGEEISDVLSPWNDAFRLLRKGGGEPTEWYWNRGGRPSLYLVSTIDGHRQLVKTQLTELPYFYTLSPDGRWLVYYDPDQRGYRSYDIRESKTRDITSTVKEEWRKEDIGCSAIPATGLRSPTLPAAGIGGWEASGKNILLYDRYDIWEVDPSGKATARNITSGNGKARHIRFRLVEGDDHLYQPNEELFLSAFDEESKDNGYYRQRIDNKGIPERLTMGPWSYDWTVKARKGPEWLIKRMGSQEYPNYWVSRDLVKFTRISELAPQRAYNWLIVSLVHWKGDQGQTMTGVLYRPEDFDPHKRYPVLMTYYEYHSFVLNDFPQPELTSGSINIPYFVSRGYVVLVPDIAFRIGRTGECALGAIVSAADYLRRQSWVDSERIGIHGHSFGGYETNYVITHSHLFAAASEGAGPSDWLSGYGELRFGNGGGSGISFQSLVEVGSIRLGATLWERPDLYLSNSPVLHADQVTTPLLMLHNKADYNVPFEQGVEFFTALRRLGKRVWMLQYDGSDHIVRGIPSCEDYTIRVEQFFDHYLKGKPAPKWMNQGIPARQKGIDSGFTLDSRREP